MKDMFFDMISDDDLCRLIESGLFSEAQLKCIQDRLVDLYDRADQFQKYLNTLSLDERWDKEVNGTLFPEGYPFIPMFRLNPNEHDKIISYMIMANLGFGPLRTGPFNPLTDTDSHRIIDEDHHKIDMIDLRGIL